MGSTPNRAIPYIEPSDQLNAYPAADKASAERLDALLYDTGWINCTVRAGYAAIAGNVPQARRIGNRVQMRGGWTNTGIAQSIYTVGDLPAGMAPPAGAAGRCALSAGGAGAGFNIDAAGAIQIRAAGSAASNYYLFSAVSFLTD